MFGFLKRWLGWGSDDSSKPSPSPSPGPAPSPPSNRSTPRPGLPRTRPNPSAPAVQGGPKNGTPWLTSPSSSSGGGGYRPPNVFSPGLTGNYRYQSGPARVSTYSMRERWPGNSLVPLSKQYRVDRGRKITDRKNETGYLNTLPAYEASETGGRNAETVDIGDGQYNRLSKRGQAAVTFNTMLSEAMRKDKELTRDMDEDGDGYVTTSEARVADDAPYVRQLRSVRPTPDRHEEVYAPNTVALLRTMGITNQQGDMRSWLNGSNLFSHRDIDHIERGEETSKARDKRTDEIISKLVNNFDRAKTGIATKEGYSEKYDFGKLRTPAASSFVDNLRSELEAGNNLDVLTSQTPERALSLEPPTEATVQRDNALAEMYTQLINHPQMHPAYLQDKEYVMGILQQNADAFQMPELADYDAWLKVSARLKAMQQSTSGLGEMPTLEGNR